MPHQPTAASPRGRAAPWLFALALALCVATLGLAVLSRLSSYYVWDDAFMFARYARNLAEEGKLAWNPRGEPTYGLTSLLYLGVVLAARAVAPGSSPAPALILSSGACGAVAVVLMVVLVARHAGTRGARRLGVLLVVLSLAFAARPLSAHFASGMDTTFAMAWLAAYVLMAKGAERSGTWRSYVLMGAWGGLAYFARPDLLVYSFAVPVALLALGGDGLRRRRALVALGATALVVAAQMGAAALTFGSALPLPFYVKGVNVGGGALAARYRGVPGRQLLRFLLSHWPLVVPLVAAAGLDLRGFLRRTSAAEKGLAAGTVGFLGYYALLVLQVMHFEQRFYYPALPALALLGARGAAMLAERVPEALRRRLEARAAAAWAAGVLAVAGCVAPSWLWMHRLWASGRTRATFGRFGLLHHYRALMANYWYRLDAFSALPDDLVMATTEIGLPGAMNPRKTIVDLAGLNETGFALHGFSADGLFAKYQPDLFYLHPDYAELNRAIRTHPRFAAQYEWVDRHALGTYLHVALWRRSGHYPAMRAIVAARRAPAAP
ncbi:MAG: glycosyltransferase family 39 protein [Candidatus Brocadiia bacterium]